MRWKAVPSSDPWQEEPAAKRDPWSTMTLLVGVIVASVVAVAVVVGVYVYLMLTQSTS
jgi:negative regulator of sigma E activity